MRSFLEIVAKGELVTVEAVTPAICLSDCRSLHDHIHKEGVPRVSSARRLALNAALRQGLRWEKWSSFRSPGLQLTLGDVLTKPVSGKRWEMLSSCLPIEVGNRVQANIFLVGQQETSVKHKVSLRVHDRWRLYFHWEAVVAGVAFCVRRHRARGRKCRLSEPFPVRPYSFKVSTTLTSDGLENI